MKYDVLYLNLNECKKHFNVGSTFSYYIIQKSINNNNITSITSEYKKQIVNTKLNFKNYKNLHFLPTHITKDTLELVNNVIKNKNKISIDRCRKLDTSTKYGKTHLKLIEDKEFKYKTYHTTTKTYYSDIKLDIYDDVKILLNMAGYLKPEICKGCNITESKFYIKTNEGDAKLMIKFLNSNNILKYLELCKYSGFNSRPVLENISYTDLNEYIIEPEENIINEIIPEIIQKGRSKYYLVDNKLYKINRNKSQGAFYCVYVNDKNDDDTKSIIEPINEIIAINGVVPIVKTKSKKSSKIATVESESEPIIKTKSKKSSKIATVEPESEPIIKTKSKKSLKIATVESESEPIVKTKVKSSSKIAKVESPSSSEDEETIITKVKSSSKLEPKQVVKKSKK